jgi:hypothetical protein
MSMKMNLQMRTIPFRFPPIPIPQLIWKWTVKEAEAAAILAEVLKNLSPYLYFQFLQEMGQHQSNLTQPKSN